MSIPIEQFNKIALKEDLNKLEQKVDKMSENISSLLNAVDGLAKGVDDINHAFVSNIAAHDRFEKRLIRLEKMMHLDSVVNDH